jgi:hypothetical protein
LFIGKRGGDVKRGRRPKQLLDEFMEKRRYWNLREETLDHTPWGTCFGRGCGTFARWMNEVQT